MSDDKPDAGLGPAVDEAMRTNPNPPTPQPVQLELLQTPTLQPLPPAQADEEEYDLIGLPKYRRAGQEYAPRLPGRPRGARNRRTQAWVDHLLARYPSPLEGLLQIGFMRVDELAASLGTDAVSALQIKIKALAEAAPYLHSRLTAVELRPPGHPEGPPIGLEAVDDLPHLVIDAPKDAPDENQ